MDKFVFYVGVHVRLVIKYPNFLEMLPSDDNLQLLEGWVVNPLKSLKKVNQFKAFLDEHDYLIVVKDKTSINQISDNTIPYTKVCIMKAYKQLLIIIWLK